MLKLSTEQLYAMLEASRFSNFWLPFCKKFKVEPLCALDFQEQNILGLILYFHMTNQTNYLPCLMQIRYLRTC